MIVQNAPSPNRNLAAAAAVRAESGAPRLLAEAGEALFKRLVHDHQQRLYRFVVKHIGWGTDAEDITQQAFVEAAQSYATFKGDSELSTWLYRNDPDGPVIVLAQVDEGTIQVTLTDHAPSFDPLQAAEPDTTLSIEERPIGGLGLLFVRRTADTVVWRPLDAGPPLMGNEVLFSKRFAPA